MEKNQNVSLGCGTLILIALIVLIFGSGPGKEQTDEIKRDLKNLQEKVAVQTEEIRALKSMVEKLMPPASEITTIQ